MSTKLTTLLNKCKHVFKKQTLAEKALQTFNRSLVLLPAFDKVSLYVDSCKNERHLECASKLITYFKDIYGFTHYYTKLCMKLQLQRIEIMHLNAICENILNH